MILPMNCKQGLLEDGQKHTVATILQPGTYRRCRSRPAATHHHRPALSLQPRPSRRGTATPAGPQGDPRGGIFLTLAACHPMRTLNLALTPRKICQTSQRRQGERNPRTRVGQSGGRSLRTKLLHYLRSQAQRHGIRVPAA